MRKFISLFLLCLFLFILTLPLAYVDSKTGEATLEDALANLPAIDLVEGKIKPAMANGDYDEALAVIDVALDAYPDDKTALLSLQQQCIDEQNFQKSPLGQVYSFSNGFITGEVKDFSSLAGTITADLTPYGDARDIVVETAKDNPDNVVRALAIVGLGLEVAPVLAEMKPAASILKILAKCKALSKRYIGHLLENLKNIAATKSLAKLPELLTPAYELFKQSESFFHFKTVMRACQDTEAIKFFTLMSKKSKKTVNELAHIFTMSGKSPKLEADIANFLRKCTTGDKAEETFKQGLAYLKEASLKGPQGLALALKNPWLKASTRVPKFVQKYGKYFPSWLPKFVGNPLKKIYDHWELFAEQHPVISVVTKTVSAALCLLLSLFVQFNSAIDNFFRKRILLSRNGISGVAPLGTDKALNKQTRKHVFFAFLTLLGIVICVLGLVNYSSEHNATINFEMGNSIMDFDATPMAGLVFLACLALFYLFALIFMWKNAKQKIAAVENYPKLSPQQRLSLLDNLDVFFDMPVYTGLGVTIFAFIIITWIGAPAARLLAYSATLAGIIATVSLRVRHLAPAREKLLKNSSESSEEA